MNDLQQRVATFIRLCQAKGLLHAGPIMPPGIPNPMGYPPQGAPWPGVQPSYYPDFQPEHTREQMRYQGPQLRYMNAHNETESKASYADEARDAYQVPPNSQPLHRDRLLEEQLTALAAEDGFESVLLDFGLLVDYLPQELEDNAEFNDRYMAGLRIGPGRMIPFERKKPTLFLGT